MDEYKPPKNNKGEPMVNRVLDVESVRAQIGPIDIMPKITKSKSVTVHNAPTPDDEYIQNYIRSRGVEIIDAMFGLAFNEDVKDNIRLSTMTALLDRGFGKPTQRTETHETVADLTSLHKDALRKLSR